MNPILPSVKEKGKYILENFLVYISVYSGTSDKGHSLLTEVYEHRYVTLIIMLLVLRTHQNSLHK